jgi:Subtilase family
MSATVSNTTSVRSRIRAIAAAAACVATFTVTSLWSGAPSSATGGAPNTRADVMDWIDDLSAPVTVDIAGDCMGDTTNFAAYRTDRIVLRAPGTTSNAAITNLINGILNPAYPEPWQNFVAGIERIKLTPLVPQPDVVSVTLAARPGGVEHEIVWLARQLIERGTPAAPDYVMPSSSHNTYYEPHGNPTPTVMPLATRSVQTPGGQPIGHGVQLAVFDTGLESAADLPTTTMYDPTIDTELVNRVLNEDDPLMVDYKHAGHGRAIAGTITTLAPGATIKVARVNDRTGLLTDVEATRRIVQVLKSLTPATRPQLVVLSFVTAACDLDPATGLAHITPIGTGAVVDMVDALDPGSPKGMLVVASAGNMSTTREHYPAAFPSVLSVGALDGTYGDDISPWSNRSRTAPVADFSNTGDWVDVYAVGVGLNTSHVHGVRFETDAQVFEGFGTVAGTSFAAPAAGAHIVEQMSMTGQRVRAAAAALLAAGEPPLPECNADDPAPSGVAIVVAELSLGIGNQPTGNPVTC